MTPPGPHLVTGYGRARRGAVAALASICLAAGCGSSPLISDSPAAAAAVAEPGAATTVGDPTASLAAPTTAPTTVPTTAPTTVPASLSSLDELLAQERFVPLAVALERSGLDDVIDGLDDFVLLAPIGTAFASAGTDVGIEFSALMNDPHLLEAVIRYHIVANPSTNPSWRTLNGAELDIRGSQPGAIERVDGVEVLDLIPVRNGSVLVMPQVLLPVSQPVGFVTESPRDD